jgi:hypothetical protein
VRSRFGAIDNAYVTPIDGEIDPRHYHYRLRQVRARIRLRQHTIDLPGGNILWGGIVTCGRWKVMLVIGVRVETHGVVVVVGIGRDVMDVDDGRCHDREQHRDSAHRRGHRPPSHAAIVVVPRRCVKAHHRASI